VQGWSGGAATAVVYTNNEGLMRQCILVPTLELLVTQLSGTPCIGLVGVYLKDPPDDYLKTSTQLQETLRKNILCTKQVWYRGTLFKELWLVYI